jgi:SAM-dependent methyltransferase
MVTTPKRSPTGDRPADAPAPRGAGPTKEDAWAGILGFVLGYEAAWVTEIGLRSGLLAAIANTGPAGATADSLAERLGFDDVLTATWSRAAFAFGLVDWDEGGGYRLAPHLAAILLDPTDPQYLGGRVMFYTALHEDFRAFPALLASGGRWARSEHDPWLLGALASMTRPDAAMLTAHALQAAPGAQAALEAGGALLEIGSGAGHHLVHYARTFPAARIVGIEVDGPSLKLARSAITDAGLGRRVALRQQDANAFTDVDAFDLVVMNITLHETGGPADWLNVLRRARAAVRPGGSVLVSELPYPDSVPDYRTDPIFRMLAGVQLHEAVVGCGAITQGELGRLLGDAGFTNVRVVPQPMKARHVMLGDRD